MTPLDYLQKLKKVDIPLAAQMAIEDTSRELASVQQDQLFQGVNNKGKLIEPKYSKRTIAIKKKKGQPTDRVTLKDTGDFYKGTVVDVRQDIFVIDSADIKSASLQKKYGADIFGLNKSSKSKYIETLKPALNKVIHDQLI